MRTFQAFTALGTLGQDPKVSSTTSGKKVANFNIATEDSYFDSSGQKKESTDWHRVTAWGELAQIAEAYLRKGVQCFVRGKVKTRSYENANGQKVYITEIIADILIPAIRAPKDGTQAAQQQRSAAAPNGYGPSGLPLGPEGEELPF